MAQTSRPCKGCGEPIYRTAPVAPIPHYHGPECRPRCAVAGCDKPQHGLTYCTAHHTRWKRTGDPLTPLSRRPNVGICGVEGCDQPMRKTGWCAGHYQQAKRFGAPRPFAYKWGQGGYVPTHTWVKRQLGAPGTHACVDCGCTAQEWSYSNADPDELRDPKHDNAAYSRKLEHYTPRCVPCHRAFDALCRRQRTP